MRILKENTLGIVIDIQENLIKRIFDYENLIKNSQILIKGLNILEIPVIVTEQYPKGLGVTIPEIKNITTDSKYYEKTSFSCFDDENIKETINSFQKKNIILFGIESHICVLQTLIDLQSFGYQTILIEDCIGSRNNLDKNISIKRALSEGAIISSYESILFELTRFSKDKKFKEISNLVK